MEQPGMINYPKILYRYPEISILSLFLHALLDLLHVLKGTHQGGCRAFYTEIGISKRERLVRICVPPHIHSMQTECFCFRWEETRIIFACARFWSPSIPSPPPMSCMLKLESLMHSLASLKIAPLFLSVVTSCYLAYFLLLVILLLRLLNKTSFLLPTSTTQFHVW